MLPSVRPFPLTMVGRVVSLLTTVIYVHATSIGRSTSLVHESRKDIPQGFVLSGPAPGDTTLPFRVALASGDLDGLENALYDVSTPSSSLYGQFLTQAEVEAFVAPTEETKSMVGEWLQSNGIQFSTISPAGNWLSFSINVEKANQLLDTEFSIFTNIATGEQTIRTLSYSLPVDLNGHINLVHPTIAFPVKAVSRPEVRVLQHPDRIISPTSDINLSVCNTSQVVPDCIRALYGLPATVGPQTASQLGVSGFLNEFAEKADLSKFLQTFRPDLQPPPTFALQTLDGGSNPQNLSEAGFEATLDTQYTVGIAGGVPVTFISVGADNQDDIDGFMDIINFLAAERNPPQVLSTSYGFDEPDVPPSVATELCNTYLQLGARGVSIIFSSGDGGVAGGDPQNCTTFIPSFPSTCPFVTSVGASMNFAPEVAGSFSAGGFSDIFPVPEYQKSAVSAFLRHLGGTNAGLFNTTGRGFPDVSAQGVNLTIFAGGQEFLIGGTSASAPIFSSTIAQINALRLKEGRHVLGFLNPLIYSFSGAFTDITSGDNPGCGTNGFPAIRGWDPVTGVGTPVFSKLAFLP